MEVNYPTIIASAVNFALLIAIGIVVFKAVKSFKNFTMRNNEMDKKLDNILNRLEDKRDN